jgi:hypothetical protein
VCKEKLQGCTGSYYHLCDKVLLKAFFTKCGGIKGQVPVSIYTSLFSNEVKHSLLISSTFSVLIILYFIHLLMGPWHLFLIVQLMMGLNPRPWARWARPLPLEPLPQTLDPISYRFPRDFPVLNSIQLQPPHFENNTRCVGSVTSEECLDCPGPSSQL